jgi:hypothetical protein
MFSRGREEIDTERMREKEKLKHELTRNSLFILRGSVVSSQTNSTKGRV